MRILCISNYYPPYFEGGYEISVKESMDYLAERGHEIFILCGSKGVANPSVNWEYIPREPVRTLKYINYQHSSFMDKHKVEVFNYKATIKALKQLYPDLVYFGNMKAISIAPVKAAQNLKIPRIFDVGDIWLRIYTSPSLKSRLFRLLKRILPFTVGGDIHLDPVIIVSQWMKQVVAKEFGSKQIYVVPRGIEVPAATPRPTCFPLKYVFAGRIEPLKGLDICIKALILILEKSPSFSFCLDIYGEEDKQYADYCRSLIETAGIQQYFCFKGKSFNLRDLLPEYDVLLMPTLASEAFGRVIIEAMAARLIVIATNAYGPSEIIDSGKDGFLFSSGSAIHLCQVIMHLNELSEAQLDTIKEQGRQKVIHNYEISLVKKQIESILENVVRK